MFRSAFFIFLATIAGAAQQSSISTPNFRDTTIKTRVTRGLTTPMIKTLRLKGARERIEDIPDSDHVGGSFMVRITQCDEQAHIELFDPQKTYRRDHFHVSSHASTFVRRTMGPTDGPPVTVTFDSVGTGERRAVGGYEAHRIKTTITVDPSENATTKKSKTKIDGWYLDIPQLRCDRPSDWPAFSIGGWFMPHTSGGRDRITITYTGPTPQGYPIEETSTQKSAGNVVVNKTELIEISAAPLDDSLFDVPPDYTSAPEPTRTGMSVISATPPQH